MADLVASYALTSKLNAPTASPPYAFRSHDKVALKKSTPAQKKDNETAKRPH